jgi:hypothetical protein
MQALQSLVHSHPNRTGYASHAELKRWCLTRFGCYSRVTLGVDRGERGLADRSSARAPARSRAQPPRGQSRCLSQRSAHQQAKQLIRHGGHVLIAPVMRVPHIFLLGNLSFTEFTSGCSLVSFLRSSAWQLESESLRQESGQHGLCTPHLNQLVRPAKRQGMHTRSALHQL